MKNKLLLFLLSVFMLTSCVEYVENTKIDVNPDKPQENVFTAKHANPESASRVGDTFIFEAMLNNTDVTKSTKFTVNGQLLKDNTYIPYRVGSNSVLAKMDEFEFSFKFNVLEKETQPDPPASGNRIEYEGVSKPVTTTFWIGYGDTEEGFTGYNLTLPNSNSPTLCTRWILVSMDATNPDDANNLYIVSDVFIPVNYTDPNAPKVDYPHQTTNFYYVNTSAIGFVFDATNHPAVSNTFNFVSGTLPSQTSMANYTATAKLQSGKEGKLYWDGKYSFQLIPDGAKSAKGINALSKVDFTKSLDITQVKLNIKK